MNETARTTASWTKQCGHCLRLLGEDGRYHDRGLSAPAAAFPAGPQAEGRLRLAPAICPECFETLRECLAPEEPARPGLAAAVA